MANITEPTETMLKEWNDWVATRPVFIQEMAKKYLPWKLYRMKSTGQRVTPLSFFEDGTLCVSITGEYNALFMDREVFGIKADDLEECELLSPDEVTGTLLSNEEVDDNLDVIRVMIRPDLWELDDNGDAVFRGESP